MDNNGYNKSVFDTEQGVCYWCGCHCQTVRHEVFYGVGHRQACKALGMWVNLCPACHRAIHCGVSKKRERKWRDDGRALLIDVLANELGEDTAMERVDSLISGMLKNWQLKEMENIYEQYRKS